MSLYIGMDVHRKRSQIAVLTEHGEELLNRNVVNDPEVLKPLLIGFPARTPVVIEAAYGWGWLVELLEELAFDPHLAHTVRCKAIAAARLKNDKVDARTLAHLLRTNLLPEAWIAPRSVRDLRLLLRHRVALVHRGTALRNRIHALLADCGYPPARLWSRKGRHHLATLPLPPMHRMVVDDCLALLDALEGAIGRLDQEIQSRATQDPRVDALCRQPGIGRLVAMTLIAEIGTIARFRTARKLAAWAGLTPVVRNSDRKVRHGHISKQGSPWLRRVLVEAAHQARTRPPYDRIYGKLARRRGRKIALVAVARRLLCQCFYILKTCEDDPLGNGEGPRAG